MSAPDFAQPSSLEVAQDTREPPHPLTAVLHDWITETLWTASYTRPRSLQRSIGPSGLGSLCARQSAYVGSDAPPVNFPDPLRSDMGTWMHAGLADIFRRLDAGTGRFVVEGGVSYKGIAGSCDLLDRRRRLVLDWKGTVLKSRKLRAHGAPDWQMLIQVTTYALAYRAVGEDVDLVALAVIPMDGALADLRVWVSPITEEMVARTEAAITDAHALRGADPATVRPTPSALCPWCSWHRPRSHDLSLACPGE